MLLAIGYWSFFGHWTLVIGHSLSVIGDCVMAAPWVPLLLNLECNMIQKSSIFRLRSELRRDETLDRAGAERRRVRWIGHKTNDAMPNDATPNDHSSNSGIGHWALGIGHWAGRFLAVLVIGALLLAGPSPAANSNAPASPPGWLAQPMSLPDALRVALLQNYTIRKGQSDLEAAYGIVVQTRAVAWPKVRGSSGYTHDESVENFPSTGTIRLFTPPKNLWSGDVRIVQSIYEGGRIKSALRTARLTKDQALLQYQAVLADTLLEVRTAYFDVLQAEQQIVVQEASVKLLLQQLTNTTQRFEAGTVPRFDVLRAEVEVANARPKLIRAKNQYRIGKNNLATLLGYSVPANVWEDIPITLTGKLEAEPYEIELPSALAQALERRPELGVLRKAEGLRKEGIITAKSSYKPNIDIFAGYAAHNSRYTDDMFRDASGAIAGVELTWDIFDGQLTKGKVMQAKALHDKALFEIEDSSRRIELEVRTAYSTFLEAREVLESQRKVQEQADEALRLAASRYDAGTGTQLDVLNAQTSLTEARTTQIQALHGYSVARARLERAIGRDVAQPVQDGKGK